MAAKVNNGSSTSFARLKNVKEDIEVNLTTAQYLRTLDSLLGEATKNIIIYTRFIDAFLIRLLGWQEKNHRRKISFRNRKEVSGLVLNFLVKTSPEDRLSAFKSMKLDRGLRIELVRAFLDSLKEYLSACELTDPELSLKDCILVKDKYEKQYPACPNLYATCKQIAAMLDSALEFRSQIQQKYVRHTLLAARRDFDRLFSSRAVELDDMVQVYWIACLRAIDKCDSDEGTLTTHISNWFFTAREKVYKQQERDVSIEGMLNNRGISSMSDEEDALESFDSLAEEELSVDGVESELAGLDDVHGLLSVAKMVDPQGAARAFLGLPEVLSEAEISHLRSLSVNSGVTHGQK